MNMNLNLNNNLYCKVSKCRFPMSHTTKAHKCGKCNNYAHGEIECGSVNRKKMLETFLSDELPNNLYCKFGGCKYFKYHTTDAHHCNYCGERSHSESTCPTNPNSAHNKTNNGHVNTEPDFIINCPLCKKCNLIPKTQTKIFGVYEKCVVCWNNNVEVYLPNCGHVCMCFMCVQKLNNFNNNLTYNNDNLGYNEEIRNQQLLKTQLYNINEIISIFDTFPSNELSNSPKYLTVFAGMGCYSIIRRLNPESELEGLFVHSDDIYSNRKLEKNNEFIDGFAHIDSVNLYHEWSG